MTGYKRMMLIVTEGVISGMSNDDIERRLPSPSAGKLGKYDAKGEVQNSERCDIGVDRMCKTHECGKRTIKVTSTKWTKNVKTGMFGNRCFKVTTLICIAKNGGQDSPKNSTPTRNGASRNNLVGRALNQFEMIENSRSFETESGLDDI